MRPSIRLLPILSDTGCTHAKKRHRDRLFLRSKRGKEDEGKEYAQGRYILFPHIPFRSRCSYGRERSCRLAYNPIPRKPEWLSLSA
jgi:hypothetical protein